MTLSDASEPSDLCIGDIVVDAPGVSPRPRSSAPSARSHSADEGSLPPPTAPPAPTPRGQRPQRHRPPAEVARPCSGRRRVERRRRQQRCRESEDSPRLRRALSSSHHLPDGEGVAGQRRRPWPRRALAGQVRSVEPWQRRAEIGDGVAPLVVDLAEEGDRRNEPATSPTRRGSRVVDSARRQGGDRAGELLVHLSVEIGAQHPGTSNGHDNHGKGGQCHGHHDQLRAQRRAMTKAPGRRRYSHHASRGTRIT